MILSDRRQLKRAWATRYINPLATAEDTDARVLPASAFCCCHSTADRGGGGRNPAEHLGVAARSPPRGAQLSRRDVPARNPDPGPPADRRGPRQVAAAGDGRELHRRPGGGCDLQHLRRVGVFERGFVTYTNRAKSEMLGVPGDLIADHGGGVGGGGADDGRGRAGGQQRPCRRLDHRRGRTRRRFAPEARRHGAFRRGPRPTARSSIGTSCSTARRARACNWPPCARRWRCCARRSPRCRRPHLATGVGSSAWSFPAPPWPRPPAHQPRAAPRHPWSAAVVAAYALATLLRLPQGYWAVFTAVIIVQSSLGATITASIERLMGTAVGAAVGAGAAILHARFPEAGGPIRGHHRRLAGLSGRRPPGLQGRSGHRRDHADRHDHPHGPAGRRLPAGGRDPPWAAWWASPPPC